MEPLNEGKPFLKGQKLSARMMELAKMICEEHGAAKAGWAEYLEHARNAGEWLIEAKWRTGHRLKWGRWKRRLSQEYDISPRTMSQYMQIARYWNDPRILDAKAQGVAIDSISGFLQVLRGQHPKLELTTAQDTDKNDNIKRILKEFTVYLRTLDSIEVEILLATHVEVFEVLDDDLRERVCDNYQGPYYKDREEGTGVPARQYRSKS